MSSPAAEMAEAATAEEEEEEATMTAGLATNSIFLFPFGNFFLYIRPVANTINPQCILQHFFVTK